MNFHIFTIIDGRVETKVSVDSVGDCYHNGHTVEFRK